MSQLLHLPADIFEKAAQTYGKTAKDLEDDVSLLEEWAKTQPHLPEVPDRRIIRNMLISNKMSIERSKQKIDNYYTIRSKIPEVFGNPKSKVLNEQVLDISYLLTLPKATKECYRVFIFKFPDDTELLKMIDIPGWSAVINNIQEVRLSEDCMLGDVFILDFQNVTMDFMLRYTPAFFKKAHAVYEKVYSIPVKAVHFINSPSYVGYMMTILKQLLKPKLFERIHVHTDDSVVASLFPKEIIPKDYGGEEKSCDELRNLWKLKFKEYSDRFDKWDSMKVDETLRPEKLSNHDDLGFHGNFKKLDFD